MAKTIHLQLTGETERLFRELANLGLTERQVLAKAIGLLRMAYTTRRVALLKPGSENIEAGEKIIDYVFTLESSGYTPKKEPAESIRDQELRAMYAQELRVRAKEHPENPDMIVMDVRMPKVENIENLEAARRHIEEALRIFKGEE